MKIDGICQRFQLSFPDYYTERARRLSVFEMFLNGEIYDNLSPFYMEYNGSSGYVPLCERKPSIIFNIYAVIVSQICSFLFGDNHFPSVKCDESNHSGTAAVLEKIADQSSLKLKMINAVRSGAVGSVAIIVKYIKGKYLYEILKTKYLSPVFEDCDENTLSFLREKIYYSGEELSENGYKIPPENYNKSYCVIREWTNNAEIYYQPFEKGEDGDDNFKLLIDTQRSCQHNLGFIPVVWIKNPHESKSFQDGRCLFEDIIDIGIEIDYQLSQHGRGLKYNSDPTLVIKDPGRLENEQLIKGTGALMLGQDGDAKLLQIDGSATKAVIDYVDKIRQFALEVIRGDRGNPDKLLSSHSGRALKILNKAIISLVSELRVSYGDLGLKKIYQMILKIESCESIEKFGRDSKIDCDSCCDHLMLDWPSFYEETEEEKQACANTLKTLADAEILSRETATKEISQKYNITDVGAERTAIEKDKQEIKDQSPQIKENINL